MAGEGENSVNRDYTFTVQITDVPGEYADRVKAALDLIKLVACGEVTQHTYEHETKLTALNAKQRDAVMEFNKHVRGW